MTQMKNKVDWLSRFETTTDHRITYFEEEVLGVVSVASLYASPMGDRQYHIPVFPSDNYDDKFKEMQDQCDYYEANGKWNE